MEGPPTTEGQPTVDVPLGLRGFAAPVEVFFLMIRGFYRIVSGALALGTAMTLAACGGGSSGSTIPQALSNESPMSARAASIDTVAAWRTSLTRAELPSAGCFQTSYPSMIWTKVQCSTPPNLIYPVPAGHAPFTNTVGNGADYTIDTGTHLISSTIGAFPKVTGVKTVKTGAGGVSGTNSYTLQMNSAFFSTAACNGESNCAGWSQFVFENPPGTGKAQLFIQDWLVPANLSGSIRCPAGKGWQAADGGCVQNSATGVNIPNVPVANLGELTETGSAASTGDSVFMQVGSTLYGMKVQSDSITDLSTNWIGTEFNIVGNAGGSKATFNAGSTITISVQANDGVLTAPTCPANSGTTGETNNLSFKAAPTGPSELQYPSILFTESNVSGGGTASCDALAGSGA